VIKTKDKKCSTQNDSKLILKPKNYLKFHLVAAKSKICNAINLSMNQIDFSQSQVESSVVLNTLFPYKLCRCGGGGAF
jgi:hypothetical protein